MPDVHHTDDVPWWDAPLPPTRHRCHPHSTGGLLGIANRIDRCPCGAIRTNTGTWYGRNSHQDDLRRR